MHEASVAQALIDVICQEADKQAARPIAARISCGQLNGLNDEVFAFAFEAIAPGTVCEGMALHIEHKPIQARCCACESTFALDRSELRCVHCGYEEFELLPDAPLVLEEIEFEKE